MLVYRITNTINGKVYIGKTLQTAEARWAEHVYMAGRNAPWAIHRAIRKYGAAAFRVEVLYRARTTDPRELNSMETFFIVLHQSHVKGNGYNLTLGGKGASGPRTPEQCKRISASKQREKNPNWGKHHSLQTLQRMRDSKLGAKNPNFKRAYTPEQRKAISDRVKGQNHPLFGIRVSAETRAKISRTLKSRAAREELCCT